jgi:hypothetical protein
MDPLDRRSNVMKDSPERQHVVQTNHARFVFGPEQLKIICFKEMNNIGQNHGFCIGQQINDF